MPDENRIGKRLWIGQSSVSNEDMLYFQDSPRDALNEALIEIAESGCELDSFPSWLEIRAWKEYETIPTRVLNYNSLKVFIDLVKDHLEDAWINFDYVFPATELSVESVQALEPFLTKAYLDWAASQNIDPTIKECWALGGEKSSVLLYLKYTPTLEEIEEMYELDVSKAEAMLSDLSVDLTPESEKDFEEYQLSQGIALLEDV